MTLDRQSDEAVAAALRSGYDVVVDLLAFTAQHARQLVAAAGDVGSVILMSTAAVYRDAEDRTLQGARDAASSPRFGRPVVEDDPVVPPDDETYAGRKRAVELALIESGLPTTVLRPAAIHGPHSPQPREWFYVRRILDGRRVFVLGYEGRSSLHPVSVLNLAEMVRLAANRPGSGILNCGDPGYPDERAIAAAVAHSMGAEVTQVLLPGEPPVATPWSLPEPVFLSTDAAASRLGYRPVASHEDAVAQTCDWIRREHAAGTFESRLSGRFGPPELGCQVFSGASLAPFDYAAEDRALARALGSPGANAA